MRQDKQITSGPLSAPGAEEEERPLGPALKRGWKGYCPRCGGGPIFDGYLKVRRRCASCGEALHHQRADDLPAWATILIVAHLVGFGFFHAQTAFDPPMWVHWAVWPALGVGLTMWLLPHIKGAVVGLQWAKRMHGFGVADEGDA